MGNQLSQPSRLQPELLTDVPNVVLKDSLGGGRFLKTLLCVHDEGGLVVVKVYYKREDTPHLRPYHEQLVDIKTRLSGAPFGHVWPFQLFFEGERAAYLVRQYIFSNLYHRLSTRPFLVDDEKRWIVYQLLLALRQSHECGVCHGDIKAENVLVTSWNWVYLTDFASYKPLSLPVDNPADFSFFFDTGGRRRCYIAPERFYQHGQDDLPSQLTPQMDIFAAGCVIAEVFLEGTALFDLSKLLAYKRGDFDPSPALAKLDDGSRSLVLHMIQRDPDARFMAQDYLERWSPALFPPEFGSCVHPFFKSLLALEPEARVDLVREAFPNLSTPDREAASDMEGNLGTNGVTVRSPHADAAVDGGADTQPAPGTAADGYRGTSNGAEAPADLGASLFTSSIDGLLQDTQALLTNLQMDTLAVDQYDGGLGGTLLLSPGGARSPGPSSLPRGGPHHSDSVGNAAYHIKQASSAQESGSQSAVVMTLLSALLCTLLRGTKDADGRTLALLLLRNAASYCDDTVKLQRIMPFVLSLIGDSQAAVRQTALHCLYGVLKDVKCLPPSDTRMFSEYLFPALSLVPTDAEESVRQGCTLAVALLSGVVHNCLAGSSGVPGTPSRSLVTSRLPPNGVQEGLQQAKVGVENDVPDDSDAAAAATALAAARSASEKLLHELSMGPRSSSGTRLALLAGVKPLTAFLGKSECNNFLLPALITYLNDSNWRLRRAFFNVIPIVAPFVGASALEFVLLPCLERANEFKEPPVIAAACKCLTQLTSLRQLRKPALIRAAALMLPRLLMHPSSAVRQTALQLVIALTTMLSSVDCVAYLWPMLAPAARYQPADLTDQQQMVDCLKENTIPEAENGMNKVASSSSIQDDQSPPLAPLAPVYVAPLDYTAVSKGDSQLTAACSAARAAQQLMGHLIAPNQVPVTSALNPDVQSSLLPHTAYESASMLVCNSVRHVPHAATNMAATSQFSPLTARLLGGGYSDDEAPHHTPVSDAMAAAMATQMPLGMTSTSYDITPWHPQGVPVAHLAEHTQCVNQIAVANNGAFFVSGSDDGTVKVWDCRRLERDVSFCSRLTNASQGGRITAVTACQDGQTVASASSTGSVHIWRVEYTCRSGGAPDRYTGIISQAQVAPGEGRVLRVMQWGPLMLYCTQKGGIHAVDPRAPPGDAWVMRQAPHEGIIRSIAGDPSGCNWLLTGSSFARLRLWDCRFHIPLASWQLPSDCSLDVMTPALAPPARIGIPGPAVQTPLVYAACGRNEIGLFDVEHGKCHQVLRLSQSEQLDAAVSGVPCLLQQGAPLPPGGPLDEERLNWHLKLQQLKSPQPGTSGALALLASGAGPLITAGTDRCIRLWNSLRPEQSYVICGPSLICHQPTGAQPRPSAVGAGGIPVSSSAGLTGTLNAGVMYRKRMFHGVPVIDEIRCAVPGAAHPAEEVQADWHKRRVAIIGGLNVCHQDVITSLAVIETQDNLLLSASRDGVINAWR